MMFVRVLPWVGALLVVTSCSSSGSSGSSSGEPPGTIPDPERKHPVQMFQAAFAPLEVTLQQYFSVGPGIEKSPPMLQLVPKPAQFEMSLNTCKELFFLERFRNEIYCAEFQALDTVAGVV